MATPNTALTNKQKKSISKSLTHIGKKAQSRNTSIQSVSSDGFNDSTEMVEEVFETPKKSAKRHLSAKSDGQEASKKKPMFITANRFALLATDNQSDPTNSSSQTPFNTDNCEDAPKKTNLNYEDAPSRSNLPPPIIVRGVLDFIGFRDELIRLIGSDNFFFKSSSNDLKIQTTKPEYYRVIIHFLKDNEAQYHTYQPREEKSYRIVIRNLHPSTPTVDIGIAIEEKGYTVRQVTNIIHKTTKVKLPIFFIDLDPAEINKEIFNLTSLLHTRVRIEEPHKRKDIVQCLNCQEYGHSRKYCAYPPRCVRCGEHHPSTSCVKTRDTPATCALCKGDHPANYKGCQIYKQIQQLQSSSNRQGTNLKNTPYINKLTNSNCKITQQPTPVANLSSLPSRSYAQATNNQTLHTPPADQTNDLALTNFINEFKALINPLLSLLTTVLDRLLSQNVK